MERHRKQAVVLSTIGVVMIMLGTTFAFFNYTRTGVSNTIQVGRIAFYSNQTNTISLLDVSFLFSLTIVLKFSHQYTPLLYSNYHYLLQHHTFQQY